MSNTIFTDLVWWLQLAGCVMRLPHCALPEAWLESLAINSNEHEEMAQFVCEWAQCEMEATKRLPEAKLDALEGLVQGIDCKGNPEAIERVQSTLEAFNALAQGAPSVA